MKKKNVVLLVFSIFLFVISIFYLNFLIWISLVPILFLIDKLKFKIFIIHSLIFSIISPAIIFHWVRYYDYSTYFVGTLLIASFLFIFLYLSKLLVKKIKYPWNIFTIPLSWTFLQFLYSFSFP